MKTAIFEEIEGHKIIRGFSRLSIDPESTKKAAKAIANEDNLAKNIRQSIAKTNLEIKSLRKEMGKLLTDGRKIKNSQLPDKDKQLKKIEARFLVKEEEVNIKREQLKDHYRDLKARTDEILNQSTIYFETTAKEIRLNENQYINLITKMKSKKGAELLTADGEIITDKRGVIFWQKKGNTWTEKTINKLGEDIPEDGKVELNAIEQKEINDQQNKNRISKLTTEQKAAEKNRHMDILLNQAAIMKAKLELQDDSDALAKAKQWLKDKEDEVKAMYK